MEKCEEKNLSFKDRPSTFKLTITKRRIPLTKVPFLGGYCAKEHIRDFNRVAYFYKFFETKFSIKHGDVFVVRFISTCGNELNGNHFVVALLDSPALSPVVTIVPLKSLKGNQLNPASDVFVGQINGLTNEKDAVAIINQIQTIDKSRLISKEIINNVCRYQTDESARDYEEIEVQDKNVYRLNAEQFNRVHTAACNYVFNGFIRRD